MKKNISNLLSKMQRGFKASFLSFIILLGMTNRTYAETPKLVSGTVDLFTTATTWLLIIIPVGAGFVLGYHAFGKSLTDDDAVISQKNKFMKNTMISAAVAMTASGLARIILGFYQ